MNALVKKEVRLLLPAFVAALTLAIVPFWVLPEDRMNPGLVPGNLFMLGTLLLALSSFGREIGLKTLPFMLAQPLERARIWWTKIAVLAVTLVLTSGALALSWVCKAESQGGVEWPAVLPLAALMVVVLTAGALWLTLLLRQIVAAFCLAFFVPLAAASVIQMLGGKDWAIATVLGFYAIAVFFLARNQFLHLQDAAWTGGVISFGRSRVAGLQTALREHRPGVAMLIKELQLQQATMIGMGCLAVLHLAAVILRRVEADVFSKPMLSALEIFGALWFVAPMMAGSVSVADERQLGTLDGLLCLPVSRRLQFVVKLLLAFALGLLSAVAFYAIERLGGGKDFGGNELMILVSVFLGLALVGFYASSLARGLVPALAAGVTTTGLLYVVCSIMSTYSAFRKLWPLLAMPMLGAVFIWLAYRNFRYVSDDWRRWRQNILVLTAFMLVVIAAPAAIYHRLWEWAMPLETAHGPSRIPVGKAALLSSGPGNGLAVVLPDGRLRVDRSALPDLGSASRAFFAGSNWVDVFQNACETAAIRGDGTLWVSERPQWQAEDSIGPLVRFGTETNWQSLGRDTFSSMFLLKQDGSLWHWGTNEFDERLYGRDGAAYLSSRNYQGLRAFAPVRLGDDSDWERILRGSHWTYAWKRDGRAWALHDYEAKEEQRRLGLVFADGIVAERLPELDHLEFQKLSQSDTVVPIEVGIRQEGTLWYWNWWSAEHHNIRLQSSASDSPRPVQIGRDSDWAEVAGGSYSLNALKTDGSIWRWSFVKSGRPSLGALLQPPERLGTHSDWVGLTYWQGYSVFLSADGTLWEWANSELTMGWNDSFLAPSGRPAKIENIFGKSE